MPRQELATRSTAKDQDFKPLRLGHSLLRGWRSVDSIRTQMALPRCSALCAIAPIFAKSPERLRAHLSSEPASVVGLFMQLRDHVGDQPAPTRLVRRA